MHLQPSPETTDLSSIDSSVVSSTIPLLYYSGEYYDCFEAGSFRRTERQKDILFWLNVAKCYGGPILELGCGTGRVSIPLAEAGFTIVGLDISERMLSTAKAKSSLVEWIQSDARSFNLGKQFQLIIFPYNALLHLDSDGVRECLSSIKKHLKPGGYLVIDITNPSPALLKKLFLLPGQEVASIFQSPKDSETIVVTRSREYDTATQTLTVKWYYKHTRTNNEITEEYRKRLYFPQEIDTLLRWSGFKVVQKLGNYDQVLFTSESPQQLIFCQID